MRFSKYGIDLSRLKEEDIELVRTWRNSPLIQQYMEYREYITPEMQKKWFDSVNNINNFYFIIHFEGRKIGLINTSNVNWEDMTSDGGIFLWEEKYYETFVPVWASLCLLEADFFVFQAKQSFIKTLKDNERAKILNKHLGYKVMENQEDVYNQQYSLLKEDFISGSTKIKKAASLLSNEEGLELEIFFDNDDIENGFAGFMESKMDLSRLKSSKKTSEGNYYYFNI